MNALKHIKRIVLCAAGFSAWAYCTVLLAFTYMVLSIVVNGGHPWPYEPYLIFGAIPAGIGGVTGVGAYLIFRKIIDFKQLLRQWEFYAGAGIVLICGVISFIAVLNYPH